MTGWYRMPRGWMDHPLFQGEAFCKRTAFQWMVEQAVYQPTTIATKGGVINLQRGQFSHSIRFMAAAWRWDEKRVRRFLDAGAAAAKIERGEAAGQTVITICNFDYYQPLPRGGAAVNGAAVPDERRGGAAKKKEGNEIKKEPPARERATAGLGYAFDGQTVRLNQRDFDQWAGSFHAIADLRAELASIDSWWQAQPEDKRRGWFHATSRMLNAKHQKAVSEQAASTAASDEAIRRMDDWDRRNPDAVDRYAEMTRMTREAEAYWDAELARTKH
ncbi:hypothetical protein [Sphingomonas montanisoli]|uniref:Uncharacterized protein n=1 Tax=Sphingomonas montanisoli TaxID=2606412 RepID=A0A5D9CBB4_9SPHN|nr:hypothetical protein [Sphingomonas montanisoli]TZG28587.1 hypothetical protein FYJ91_00045 [Sphingomonas montanisoli]